MSATDRTLLTSEFDFALSLLNKLSVDKSCIVSPFSISLALSLVHSGTKGTARKEIEQLLLNGAANTEFSQHFSNLIGNISKIENGVDFQLANRVFVKKDYILLDSYLSSIRNNYKADAVSLDFADKTGSSEAVNSFVNEVTHGKIKEIVKPEIFDDLTLIILVNALYMKGEFAKKFNKDNTRPGTFYASETVEKKVDFMAQWKVDRDFYQNDHYQLLSLEYKDTRYRLNIFLAKTRFDLSKLQAELNGATIELVLNNQMKTQLLNIKLPKFKLESDIELIPILKALGIEGIFSPSKDLSGFAGTDDLYVSEAIHKGSIEVDEKGSVATAASYIEKELSCDYQPSEFKADHPFLFCITFNNHPIFIVDEHGSVATSVSIFHSQQLSDVMYICQPIDFISDHPFMFCITFNNHLVFIGKYY